MQAREPTLAFKLRADVINSPKRGYQWPHKRTDVLLKIVKKDKKVFVSKMRETLFFLVN